MFPVRLAVSIYLAVVLSTPLLWAQARTGEALFADSCAGCHLANVIPRALSVDNMRAMTPEAIVGALTDGSMQQQGSELSAADRQAIAEFITGSRLDSVAGDRLGWCAAGRATEWSGLDSDPAWNGWGVDIANTRNQPAQHAGLNAEDIPKLTLKWAFGYPNASSAQSQPAVVGGRLFVASQRGEVYALDAKTGCKHWMYEAQSGVRSAISIARIDEGRSVVFFGDFNAHVYALDAETGMELWSVEVDDHEGARITGAPVLYDGRLYVPVSSSEEGLAADPEYACCTFRGSVVALESATGKRVWKSYLIPDEPRPRGRNPEGLFLWGPAGAAVWSAPTIDPGRQLVYVATGNAYTEPAAETSDAILALDMETGDIRWSRQFTPSDAFVLGCRDGNANCPTVNGPDFDFGASPVLVNAAEGRSFLVVGQKSGLGYGLDPDREGATIWQYRIGQGSALGGVEWGFAVDTEKAYFGNSDYLTREPGGLAAVRLRTGELVWFAEAHEPVCEGCSPALLAAITVIPGAVFSGASDGLFRAYSSRDGSVLWEYDTNGPHQTVNGVEASGGSINGPGPVVVDGMVYVNSGYAAFGGRAGNALLAFSVDE